MSLLFCISLQAQARWTWDKVLPLEEGTSYALSLNPLNNEIVYTHLSGKLKVSYTGGFNWTDKGDLPFELRGMKTLMISPADTSVFLACGSAGLWRSADGGQTWTNVIQNVLQNGEALDYDRAQPEIIYFADFGTGDFYVSPDLGSTWELRSRIEKEAVCSLASHPVNSGVVIASAFGNIFKTTDAGFTWSKFSLGTPDSLFFENPKIIGMKTTRI